MNRLILASRPATTALFGRRAMVAMRSSRLFSEQQSYSEDNGERPPRSNFNNNRNFRSDERNKRTVFVGNLSFQMTEDNLRDIFAAHGPLEQVKIMFNKETGRSRGFGFVTFTDEESAQEAAKRKDLKFRDRPINVAPAQGQKRREESNYGQEQGDKEETSFN